MSGSKSSEEKVLPPSAKKLREGRRKGQIAHSKEMVTAAVTLTAFSYLYARSGAFFDGMRDALLAASAMVDRPFAEALSALAPRLGSDIAWLLAPFVGLIAAAAVLSNVVVNGGLLATPDPLLPKMERLDPVAGFGRLFSLRNLIELVKSVLKLALVGTVVVLVVAGSLQALVEQPSCGLPCAGPALRWLLRPLLIAAGGFFLVLGALDIGTQRWLFRRDMRMTRTEQRRERKEQEGDPLIKGLLRREQRNRAQSAARAGLRHANFVIRSGDAALAMRFAQPDAAVPMLLARATGEGTAALVEEARRLRIPVVSDAATVRLLTPRLKVGQFISQDLFDPVIACMKEAGVL